MLHKLLHRSLFARYRHLSLTLFLAVIFFLPVGFPSQAAEENQQPATANSMGGNGVGLTKAERAWVKAHPSIKILALDDWPPFDFRAANGAHTGITAEVVKLAAQRVGLELVPVFDKWSILLEKLKNKELDLAPDIYYTQERESFVVYTKPYLELHDAIFTSKSNVDIVSSEDLDGRVIAIEKGFALEGELAKKYPKARLLPVATALDALKAVSIGNADVYVGAQYVASYLIDQKFIPNLKIVSYYSDEPQRVHMAARKDWPILRDIMDKGLASITPAEHSNIRSRFFTDSTVTESQISNSPRDSYFMSSQFLIGIAALTALFVILVVAANRIPMIKKEGVYSSLRVKVIGVSSVFLFLLAVLFGSWLTIQIAEDSARKDTLSNLKAVLRATHEIVNVWANDRFTEINRISNNPALVARVEALLDVSPDRTSLIQSKALAGMRDFLAVEMGSLESQGFFIITPDGISIGSRRDSNLGTLNLIAKQQSELFGRITRGETVLVPPILSDIYIGELTQVKNTLPPTMFFASPVRNSAGQVIAALTVRLDPAKSFSRYVQSGQIGDSGETYAFDGDGRMLSNSRFDRQLVEYGLIGDADKSSLNIFIRDPGRRLQKGEEGMDGVEGRPLTVMAASATTGHSGNDVSGYRDYRGVPVMGAWLWDRKLGIGVATEIDVDEALGTFRLIRTAIAVVLGLTVLMAMVLTGFAVWIGRSANRSLKKARNSLERQVQERTMELENSHYKVEQALTDLQTSEDRYRQIAEIASDWVWEMDENLRFSYFSETFTPFTRADPSSLLGKTREEVASQEDLANPKWQDHLEDLNERREFKDFQYEFSIPGSEKWFFSISGTPVFDDDNKFCGYRGTGTNVTEKVSSALALEEAKAEAETANQAKSEFLSSMSHELRTPLNAIVGFSQLLEMDTDYPLNEDQKESVSHIIKGGKHLLALINEILDLAKIESGKLSISIEDVAPGEAIEACLNLVSDLGAKKNIQVDAKSQDCKTCPNPCLIRVDQNRFKQVLLNLLSNAVKYNRQGGSVSLTCERRDNGAMRYNIIDTGMGIPEDQQKDLFVPFHRLHAEDSSIEGTGIGLAITRRLVELMDGDIGFSSVVGEGTTFWVEFPLVEENAEVESSGQTEDTLMQTSMNQPSGAAHGTVLYIEDNPANLMLMEKIFKRLENVKMISAHTAELGLVLAEQEMPDLILMDINLPGMNGIEALKQVRASETLHNIPVVAVSANAMPSDIEKAMKAGFKGYITKPFKINEILTIVSSLV